MSTPVLRPWLRYIVPRGDRHIAAGGFAAGISILFGADFIVKTANFIVKI
jgi:hypothetical protein